MGRIAAVLGTFVLVIGLFALGPASMVGAQGTGTGTGTGTGPGTGTGTGPGTGTGTGTPCSHGFFKNHTEFWFGWPCQEECDGLSDAALLSDLRLKGGGQNKLNREFARDCLNLCTGCME